MLYVILIVGGYISLLLCLQYIKPIACKIGWHAPQSKRIKLGFDGCSVHARCPWCGFEGMEDSQGGLF